MGTILHEGEYILISNKIVNETGYIGYPLLTHIGVNTSKVNLLGSTRHFCTYAVIKDLVLPFNTTEWQDFEVRSVRFYAYTHNFKNLILFGHDECCLDYIDEVDEFFEKKKKEKKNMLNNKFIVNEDYFMTGAGSLTSNPYFDIKQSVPDKLPEITLEDLRIESSVRTEPMIRGTFRVGPGIVRQPSKFQFTQYVGHTFLFNGGYINYKKPPLKFKLIFGQEHATGRYKTICLWEDGEKTIICGDNKVTKLPVAQAFAWCYVKRTFRSVSQFKKHVDKRTTKMDGVWYFEGDCLIDEYAQGSVPGTSKKRDIYDASALAIASKRYGGLRKLVDEYINKKED